MASTPTTKAPSSPTTAPKSKRELLLDAYQEQLLEKPPVKGLQPGERDRGRLARTIALKDIERFAHALQACGLRVTVIPPPAPAEPTAQEQAQAPEQHQSGAETPLAEMTRARLWGEWKMVQGKARSLRLHTPILPIETTDTELANAIFDWRAKVAHAEEQAGVR